jgi:hypothetical protein
MRIGMGIVLLVVITAGGAWAGDVDWNVNINLGSGRAGRPVGVPLPPPGPPVPVIVNEPPLFLVPASLGFWVAVGVPYDMVFIDGRYYLFHGNYWHVSSRHHGPWSPVLHEHLPPGLRKHKYSKIRDHRDREYYRYEKEGGRYRGQAYRPEHKKGKREHPGKGKGRD